MVVLSRARSSIMIAFISVLALLAACPVYADDDIAEENGVWILNSTNFEATIYQNKFVLVYFYSADCDHCKELAPVLPEVAAQLRDDQQAEIRVAQVDGPASPRLTIKYGITSYPTIFFFRSGEQSEYTGGHSTDDFISWLQKKTQSPVVELLNKTAAQAFINSSSVVVVGFFKEKNSEGAREFLKAASDVDDVAFGVTYSAEVSADNNVKGDTVVLFKKFDKSRSVFEGKLSQEEITTFIQLNELPDVVEFTRDVVEKLFDHVVKKHLLLFLTSTIKDKFLDVYRNVSKDFQGQFLFIYVDVDNENTAQIVRYFGLDKDTVPALRLVNLGDDMKKYQPESRDIDSVVIRQFLRDFLGGNLQEVEITHEKEEEPQDEQDEKEQTTGEPSQETNEEDQVTSGQPQNDRTHEQSGLDRQKDVKESETQEDASKEEKEDEDSKKVEASATKEKEKDAPSKEERSSQAEEEKVASKNKNAGKQKNDTSSQDGDSKAETVLSREDKSTEEEEASIQEEEASIQEEEASIQEEEATTQDDADAEQEQKETAIPQEESTVQENKKEKGEQQEEKETPSNIEEALTQAEEGETGEEEEEASTKEEGASTEEKEEEEKDTNQDEEEKEETTPKEATRVEEDDKDENREVKETQEEATTQEDEEKKEEKQEKEETSSKKEESIKKEKKISKIGREEL